MTITWQFYKFFQRLIIPGNLHRDTMCFYCSESPIHGMKWTCIKCFVDLCSKCYMKDLHDVVHYFERTDTPESRRYANQIMRTCIVTFL